MCYFPRMMKICFDFDLFDQGIYHEVVKHRGFVLLASQHLWIYLYCWQNLKHYYFLRNYLMKILMRSESWNEILIGWNFQHCSPRKNYIAEKISKNVYLLVQYNDNTGNALLVVLLLQMCRTSNKIYPMNETVISTLNHGDKAFTSVRKGYGRVE